MYLKITSLAPDPYIVKELVLVVCYFTWLNGIWGKFTVQAACWSLHRILTDKICVCIETLWSCVLVAWRAGVPQVTARRVPYAVHELSLYTVV